MAETAIPGAPAAAAKAEVEQVIEGQQAAAGAEGQGPGAEGGGFEAEGDDDASDITAMFGPGEGESGGGGEGGGEGAGGGGDAGQAPAADPEPEPAPASQAPREWDRARQQVDQQLANFRKELAPVLSGLQAKLDQLTGQPGETGRKPGATAAAVKEQIDELKDLLEGADPTADTAFDPEAHKGVRRIAKALQTRTAGLITKEEAIAIAKEVAAQVVAEQTKDLQAPAKAWKAQEQAAAGATAVQGEFKVPEAELQDFLGAADREWKAMCGRLGVDPANHAASKPLGKLVLQQEAAKRGYGKGGGNGGQAPSPQPSPGGRGGQRRVAGANPNIRKAVPMPGEPGYKKPRMFGEDAPGAMDFG